MNKVQLKRINFIIKEIYKIDATAIETQNGIRLIGNYTPDEGKRLRNFIEDFLLGWYAAERIKVGS